MNNRKASTLSAGTHDMATKAIRSTKGEGTTLIHAAIFLAMMVIGVASGQGEAVGQNRVFRAGASTSNITPPLGLPIVGNYDSPLATHVHDELHVRSLVLDDGTSKLVFAIADNVGIDRRVFDEAKRFIHDATGLPYAHMMMAATHTHSATSAGGLDEKRRGWNEADPLDEYQKFLARRIADGVLVALNNLEPARIAWGVGSVPQHVFNRR